MIWAFGLDPLGISEQQIEVTGLNVIHNNSLKLLQTLKCGWNTNVKTKMQPSILTMSNFEDLFLMKYRSFYNRNNIIHQS